MLKLLPSVCSANNMVLQEEQQRKIRNVVNPLKTESSTFLAHQRQQSFLNKSLVHSTSHGLHHTPVSFGSQPPSYSQPFHNNPGNRRSTLQCNYCRKPGHAIDKCYKIQRMRGQNDRGRRLAATVQQNDSEVSFTDSSSTQSTGLLALTSEQYEQLIPLLSKQNIEVTTNLENQQSAAYLAGKSFSLLNTQPEMK